MKETLSATNHWIENKRVFVKRNISLPTTFLTRINEPDHATLIQSSFSFGSVDVIATKKQKKNLIKWLLDYHCSL